MIFYNITSSDIVIFHNSRVAGINIESREITVTGLPSNTDISEKITVREISGIPSLRYVYQNRLISFCAWFRYMFLSWLECKYVKLDNCSSNPGSNINFSLNPLGAMSRSVWLVMISCKKPATSQCTLFIFQVVKLPLCQAAVDTFICTKGRSKLPYFMDRCGLLQK